MTKYLYQIYGIHPKSAAKALEEAKRAARAAGLEVLTEGTPRLVIDDHKHRTFYAAYVTVEGGWPDDVPAHPC